MRRYFKTVHISGETHRFSREQHQLADELEDLFGLIPGEIMERELERDQWVCDDLKVLEITEQEYNAPELKELCDFYSLAEFSYT